MGSTYGRDRLASCSHCAREAGAASSSHCMREAGMASGSHYALIQYDQWLTLYA